MASPRDRPFRERNGAGSARRLACTRATGLYLLTGTVAAPSRRLCRGSRALTEYDPHPGGIDFRDGAQGCWSGQSRLEPIHHHRLHCMLEKNELLPAGYPKKSQETATMTKNCKKRPPSLELAMRALALARTTGRAS